MAFSLQHIDRLTESYRRLRHQYQLSLMVGEDIVFVKGLTAAEREHSSASVLRGAVQIQVNRAAIPMKSIQIRLFGQLTDVVFLKGPNYKRLDDMNHKVLIDDVYNYTSPSQQLLRGHYTIPFQFAIDRNTPETIVSLLATRKYHLEVEVDCHKKHKDKKMIIRKPITIIRCPSENSLLLSESASSVGDWRGLMSYSLYVDSKICHLDDYLTISMKAHPNHITGPIPRIKYVKIHFIQRLKCPILPKTDVNPYYFENQKQLMLQSSYKKQDDFHRAFDESWTIKIAKDMEFEVFPFNSCPDLEEGNTSQMTIKHYVTITIGLEIQEIFSEGDGVARVSYNKGKTRIYDDKYEVTFRTQIHILSPLAKSFIPPPAYRDMAKALDSSSSSISTTLTDPTEISSQSTRSSAWLCTNGKYENETPPKYRSLDGKGRLRHRKWY